MENQINNNQNNVGSEMNEENLKSKVLELIEREKIKPTTKLYFSIKDKAVWSLLLVSILIGSIACSVVIFSITNSEAGLYQVTHDSLLSFVLYCTPYLWIFVFVVFALIAYEDFKYTSKGYKYSFGIVLVTGLIINLIFGVVLHSLGVSRIIDQSLSSDSIFITSSSDSLRKMSWNQPDNGVLSGEVVSYSDGSSSLVLKDFNGKLWTVSYMYIPKVSVNLVSTSSQVRVIGVRQNVYFPSTTSTKEVSASTTPYMGSVVACYILPWNTDEYFSGISKIKGYLVSADASERNISDKRNNDCRALKSYNIIRSMVELK